MAHDRVERGLDVLIVAAEEVPCDNALAVVVGYCLGEERVTWKRPISAVGDELKALRRGAFAFGTYDCVEASQSHRLEPIDILVADGLNAQLRAGDIGGVLAVADAVSDELARIGPGVKFWELPRDEVVTPPSNPDRPAWAMWRAWTILMGVEGVDVARAHKILHHKRPSVFPLLDNATMSFLGKAGAWAAIHDNLTEASAAWRKLETDIGRLLSGKNMPAPTRLRLHDILLWTRATGRRPLAYQHGRKALAAD